MKRGVQVGNYLQPPPGSLLLVIEITYHNVEYGGNNQPDFRFSLQPRPLCLDKKSVSCRLPWFFALSGGGVHLGPTKTFFPFKNKAYLGSSGSMTTITATIGSFPSPGRKDLNRKNSISFGTCVFSAASYYIMWYLQYPCFFIVSNYFRLGRFELLAPRVFSEAVSFGAAAHSVRIVRSRRIPDTFSIA